jgi:protein involved in polysaccharide export with SLBB domain
MSKGHIAMKFSLLSTLLLAGIASAPTIAQVAPSPAVAASLSSVAVDPDYRIAAGDVLSVTVVNFPFLSTPQMVVAPDGTIQLNLIAGSVHVSGLTQEQATALMVKKWKKQVFNPAVTVALLQKHPQIIVLNGYLNRSGTVDYRPGLHLLDALAQMGGALPTADASNAVLTHADGTKQKLDLSHPEKKAGSDVDVALQPGDVLYVPEQQGKISVVGEVKDPGNIPYKENLTVLDVINASGSYNPDTADLNEATLTHNGVVQKLDLDALLRQGDLHANATLSPGDIVTIPLLHNRTYVFGDVQRPAYYYFKPGDRVLDALSNAGVAPDADTGKINLIHTNPDKTVSKMVRVNADEFLLHGNLSGNPAILPGDSLYIPRKHEQFNGNSIMQVLNGVGAIANTGYLLNRR